MVKHEKFSKYFDHDLSFSPLSLKHRTDPQKFLVNSMKMSV